MEFLKMDNENLYTILDLTAGAAAKMSGFAVRRFESCRRDENSINKNSIYYKPDQPVTFN
jgi:hypothetical protein